MSRQQPTKSSRCTHTSLGDVAASAGGGSAIHLPVLGGDHNPRGQIRASRSARRRAIVLVTVQLLLIVHIVVWVLSKKYGWWGGRTITPIEPSESMEFVKSGVINAGLIFFAAALLSTLIFGRWFCGWGCHVVLLQDFCGWIMKKCGVRPKPFRSRVLVYVPLILAIYMFIMPAVHRWGLIPLDQRLTESLGADHWLVQGMQVSFTAIGFPLPYSNIPPWTVSTHLTTDDFWRTFATYGIAIPFLFICGFAVVYFLGSKGFCTYGCPYGGFFSPVDRLSPARILVTDACEGCGHCTAVCTSNVRVHEEVREYGMVVDPGCMKCLDCVSVCPKDALYFGFAKPSLFKGAAKHEKPRKIYDLTIGEEIACSAVFLLTFLAVRGVYGLVPMLMAVGIAGIMTFLTWKLWRLVRDPNVSLYRYQFKLKGSMRTAGWIFATIVAVLTLLTIDLGIVNGAMTVAKWHDAKVIERPELTFSATPQPLPDDMAEHARKAISMYRLASHFSAGGVGPLTLGQLGTDLRIATLQSELLDFAASEQTLRDSIRRHGNLDSLCASLMWVLHARGQRIEALNYGEQIIRANRNYQESLITWQQLAFRTQTPEQFTVNAKRLEDLLQHVIAHDGPTDLSIRLMMIAMYVQDRMLQAMDFAEPYLLEHADFVHTMDTYTRIGVDTEMRRRTIEFCRRRLERFPDHLHTMRVLSVELMQTGGVEEAIEIIKRTLEIEYDNPSAHYFLALGYMDLNRLAEARESMEIALRMAPHSIPINSAMADLLGLLGEPEQGEMYRQKAAQLHQQQMQHQQPMQHAH